jgi:hypothetical protein
MEYWTRIRWLQVLPKSLVAAAMKTAHLGILILIALLWFGPFNSVEACQFCTTGFGGGGANKALEELEATYESQGRDALPYIREVLTRSTDPNVVSRAVGYIGELDDRESLPLLEDLVSAVTRRVAFGDFGFGTFEFYCRLSVAHTLIKFGSGQKTADWIWKRYDRVNIARKSEVPYLLDALGDSQLDERLLKILEKEEQQEHMIMTLYVLRLRGSANAVAGLQARVDEWEKKGSVGTGHTGSKAPAINYSQLVKHAERAILSIKRRNKLSALIH